MEVKLLISSVYYESVIQVSIHTYRLQSRHFALHTYRLQSRHFALLLSYWNAKGRTAPLTPPPPWQTVRVKLPLVPEPQAVFEKNMFTGLVS